jgi:hypothetical protein
MWSVSIKPWCESPWSVVSHRSLRIQIWTSTWSFPSVCAYKKRDAEYLVDTVKSVLNDRGINIANCRSQSYDDASNMSGMHSGANQDLHNATLWIKITCRLWMFCVLRRNLLEIWILKILLRIFQIIKAEKRTIIEFVQIIVRLIVEFWFWKKCIFLSLAFYFVAY